MWGPRLLAALTVAAVLAGCGRSTRVSVQPPSQQQRAKSVLQDVARKGVFTSGISIVRPQLEEMKKTDAAKAEALLKDLKELESLRDPAAIKAKAGKMAEKM